MGTGPGAGEIARRLIVRRKAEQDLTGILRYSIENWGLERAAAYRDLVFKTINRLAKAPARGPPAKHAPGLRTVKAGQHRIYYSFDDEVVVIIRVLHYAMDAPRHLS